MRNPKQQSSFQSAGNSILVESIKYGPVVTFLVMALLAGGLAYVIYLFVLADWVASNAQWRQAVVKKEVDNKVTEAMIAGEPQFLAEFRKVADVYTEAKPLLPQETEVADVLGQVEAAARRNGVTLSGLQAVKASIKSPKAEKLYEREIPALVTGPYPQVVRFFDDISKMPRILQVRDYSIAALSNSVSAGFTLVAYHAPPPTEMPPLPANVADEPSKNESEVAAKQ
jgi:Tfp pilus assembly protein PilO